MFLTCSETELLLSQQLAESDWRFSRDNEKLQTALRNYIKPTSLTPCTADLILPRISSTIPRESLDISNHLVANAATDLIQRQRLFNVGSIFNAVDSLLRTIQQDHRSIVRDFCNWSDEQVGLLKDYKQVYDDIDHCGKPSLLLQGLGPIEYRGWDKVETIKRLSALRAISDRLLDFRFENEDHAVERLCEPIVEHLAVLGYSFSSTNDLVLKLPDYDREHKDWEDHTRTTRRFDKSKWNDSFSLHRLAMKYPRYAVLHPADNRANRACVLEMLLTMTDTRELLIRTNMLTKMADDMDARFDVSTDLIKSMRQKFQHGALSSYNANTLTETTMIPKFYHRITMLYIRNCTGLHYQSLALLRAAKPVLASL